MQIAVVPVHTHMHRYHMEAQYQSAFAAGDQRAVAQLRGRRLLAARLDHRRAGRLGELGGRAVGHHAAVQVHRAGGDDVHRSHAVGVVRRWRL